MDTVKTLVAFCHLQRAACAVWRTAYSVQRKYGEALALCDETHCQRQPASQAFLVYCAPAASAMSCQLYNKFASLTAATPTRPSPRSTCPLATFILFRVQNFCCPAAVNSFSLHFPYTSEEHMTGHTARMCNMYLLLVFHLSIDYSSVRQPHKVLK